MHRKVLAFAETISSLTGISLTTRKKFEAFTHHSALTYFRKNLSVRANLFKVNLLKITNDIQFLGSHPRSGFKRTKRRIYRFTWRMRNLMKL